MSPCSPDERPQADSAGAPPAAQTCVVCGKPQDAKYKPFCSKRCADIDLSRWLKGVYAVPGEEGPEKPPDETGGST